MNAVKLLGISQFPLHALLRDDAKASSFNLGVDGACQVALCGVRLDD